MRVTEYLDFVAEIKDVPYRDRKSRVLKVVDDCGLEKMTNRLIGKLSKGYRQRVGLAQSLVNDPEVLVLDEPTIGLDPTQIIEIRELIKNLAGKRTVILSSHILPEVSMLCQRVVIINEGQLIAIDTPANLTRQLEQSRRIIVEVDGKSSDVIKVIKTINGVNNVSVKEQKEPAEEVNIYEIETVKEKDLRREISYEIIKNNFGLLELRPVVLTLEDVFVKLVTKEDSNEKPDTAV